MSQSKSFWLIAVILLVSLFIPFLKFDSFITSDLWERQRVSQQILDEGSFPETNPSFSPEIPYIYAPLFDVLLASLMQLTGLDFLFLIKLLSLLVGFFFVSFSFLLAKKFFSEETALLAAFFVAFAPRIFRLLIQPIPETIGLLCIVIVLYLVLCKHFKAAGLIAASLMLFHSRSFLNLFLVLLIFCFSFRKNLSEFKGIHWLIVLPLIFSPVYWLEKISLFSSVQLSSNPFVFEWNSFQMFGFSLVLAALAFIYLFREKNYFLINWIVVYIALFFIGRLFSKTIFSFRELIYLFFPLALASAYLLIRVVSQLERVKLKLLKPVLLFVLLGLALFLAYSVNLDAYPGIDFKDRAAMTYLKTQSGQVVFSGFVSGYGLPVLAEKKVVVGAFMEAVPDADERLDDVRKFLEAENAENAADLLEKYDSSLVLLSRFELRGFYDFELGLEKFDDPGFDKVYANESNWVFKAN